MVKLDMSILYFNDIKKKMRKREVKLQFLGYS